MTLKEMKDEYARLGKLIREEEEGRRLKHEFIQAEWFTVPSQNGKGIGFRVMLYDSHMWKTIIYADSAKQALDDLDSLRDALDRFIMEFSQWAEQKEADE